jgi:hypothetical protein
LPAWWCEHGCGDYRKTEGYYHRGRRHRRRVYIIPRVEDIERVLELARGAVGEVA